MFEIIALVLSIISVIVMIIITYIYIKKNKDYQTQTNDKLKYITKEVNKNSLDEYNIYNQQLDLLISLSNNLNNELGETGNAISALSNSLQQTASNFETRNTWFDQQFQIGNNWNFKDEDDYLLISNSYNQSAGIKTGAIASPNANINSLNTDKLCLNNVCLYSDDLSYIKQKITPASATYTSCEGVIGLDGRDGLDGVMGEQGPIGLPGINGMDGKPGQVGPAGTAIKSVSVTSNNNSRYLNVNLTDNTVTSMNVPDLTGAIVKNVAFSNIGNDSRLYMMYSDGGTSNISILESANALMNSLGTTTPAFHGVTTPAGYNQPFKITGTPNYGTQVQYGLNVYSNSGLGVGVPDIQPAGTIYAANALGVGGTYSSPAFTVDIHGNMTTSGALNVNNTASLCNNVNISGQLNMNSSHAFINDTTTNNLKLMNQNNTAYMGLATGDLQVNGNTTVSGTTTLNGTTNINAPLKVNSTFNLSSGNKLMWPNGNIYGDTDMHINSMNNLYIVTSNLGISTSNFNLNSLYFSSNKTGNTDTNANASEFVNDTSLYKELAIIGNKSADGKTHQVGIWDNLNVYGNATINSNLTIQGNLTVNSNSVNTVIPPPGFGGINTHDLYVNNNLSVAGGAGISNNGTVYVQKLCVGTGPTQYCITGAQINTALNMVGPTGPQGVQGCSAVFYPTINYAGTPSIYLPNSQNTFYTKNSPETKTQSIASIRVPVGRSVMLYTGTTAGQGTSYQIENDIPDLSQLLLPTSINSWTVY